MINRRTNQDFSNISRLEEGFGHFWAMGVQEIIDPRCLKASYDWINSAYCIIAKFESNLNWIIVQESDIKFYQ